MSDFLTGLKEANNLTFTENGALTHRSTTSELLVEHIVIELIWILFSWLIKHFVKMRFIH